jgi:hypothetical protein
MKLVTTPSGEEKECCETCDIKQAINNLLYAHKLTDSFWHSPELKQAIIAGVIATHSNDEETMLQALEDLYEATPNQTEDCDWWSADLSKAMFEAERILDNTLKSA